MSFVAAAASVGTWAGLTGTAAVIGGGAMIGAGVGGAYSALTGDGNILDSMLTGAGIGGLGAWGLNAAGVGAGAGAAGAGASGAGATGVGATAAETAAASNPALAAYGGENAFAYNAAGEMVPANYAADITGATNLSEPFVGPPDSAKLGFFERLTPKEMLGYGLGATTLMGLLGGQQETGVAPQGDKGMIRPYEYSTAKREPAAGQSYYFEPIEYDKYGKTTKPIDTAERNYFNQKFTALPTYSAAIGGQVPPALNNMPAGGLSAIQSMRDGYGAQQTMDGNIPQFADGGFAYDPATQKFSEVSPPSPSTVQPVRRQGLLGFFDAINPMIESGAFDDETMPRRVRRNAMFESIFGNQNQLPANNVGAYLDETGKRYLPKYEYSNKMYNNITPKAMAEGGDLGGYAEGQLLKGPGDGVSDEIPATINGKQPARLADGEFVIPARIVSELGNGSTDAGAKRLYEMMDRIQENRKKTVGKGKVAVDSKSKKHLPA